ncbi:fumarylacetoacetate hydrolase family protein [Facklamia sp. DSM 111018]|uniref:Fumarylacetoacetate hydrolase family protein n=1 Tax=Facklamia lactis TaxID=2749967 RepID=A0ABS0LS54_9LACT|nr:fumarylacetoacetate hydrolase family protein [Facklamia lactis]MBG9981194.1 fumarylacetoacetate hydrolase family protein [Facklamia lactis]MBG9986996.1 fumarylacetoacetate hydrolase family protein [Facklamia lactis]
MEKNYQAVADYVFEGQKNRKEITKITKDLAKDYTVEDAYKAQEVLLDLWKKEGAKLLAPKMGLTSKAKWDQMGVDSPIVGYIFEDMIETMNEIQFDRYIHPKVEPEIGIVLKKNLKGNDLTIQDVLDNIDYVFSCVEVIDSRYENFDFDLVSVIADNTSAAGAVFGNEKTDPKAFDLSKETVKLYVNDEIYAEGDGSAVLGHPAEAIVALAKHLNQYGEEVKAGQPIMTGGITAAPLIQPGDKIRVEYDHLQNLEITVR